MNQEEIKKLAIECGAHVHENGTGFNYEELAAYTAAVEARERERCAVVLDNFNAVYYASQIRELK